MSTDIEKVVNQEKKIGLSKSTNKSASLSTETIKHPKSSRKRIPLGTRNILTAPKKPGFVRRFVNDTGDRIQTFKDAGWVTTELRSQVGDDKAGRATSMGSGANPSVGGGQRAVLMELPEKYYEEDVKANQVKITEVEKEIARKQFNRDGLEGQVSIY